MDIKDFANQYRLRVKKDECGDPVIEGRIGQSHLYEYSGEELGMCFMPTKAASDSPRTGLWNKTRDKCVAAGMVVRQCGDDEGCLTFDPSNPEQAKLAIRSIKARVKRQLTPEQLERLAKVGFKASGHTVEAIS